jgi:peptidoglycan/xylan/chitin deacetylase (PgdA/CDA1 family)
MQPRGRILLSVDMDEWYQCRWATGSDYAIWPDTAACFREYYGSDRPGGEILPLTDRILDLFARHGARATFFFTGEIAGYYPDLVRRVAEAGHEIGSHNFVHKDYNEHNREEFRDNLWRSKRLLEDLAGQPVVGYRAPNSTLASHMIRDLIEAGFRYDSSVTPTRPFMGKFGRFVGAPLNPYELSEDDFGRPGHSGLWEFPWPVFPFGRLPSGSGIMTRIAGYRYTVMALDHALRTGDSVYYFHPYETGPKPKLRGLDLKTRIFLRNCGRRFSDMLRRLIERYAGRLACGRDLLAERAGAAGLPERSAP